MDFNFSEFLFPSLFFSFPKANIHFICSGQLSMNCILTCLPRKNSYPYLLHSFSILFDIRTLLRKGKHLLYNTLIYRREEIRSSITHAYAKKTWSIWLPKFSTCQKDLIDTEQKIKLVIISYYQLSFKSNGIWFHSYLEFNEQTQQPS